MAVFQNSVLTKYFDKHDKKVIAQKWNVYKSHFLNADIQQNIRNSKEEEYQGEFLIDLFVNVLGYTKKPNANFNLTTELKNEKDSKKADGGIIINDTVIAVIELKGTNSTDFQKIEIQAFGYKNNQKDCVYVITSNFEKLRFYIDNAIDYLEFNLFTLTEKQFELLYLCLAFENISKGIPKKLKEESVSQEDLITKKLYKDYSLFKRELYQNLIELNPQFDALELFKKSQKLLDRFLFLFFAEDRQLLPPNSVRLILDQWKQLKSLDEYVPLYQRFKKFFGYLNNGYKGDRYDVFAYNGGLFKPDEILDAIIIDDQLLHNHTSKISEYDFASEVDVNILGHIFENSLNELDEIQAQLEGVVIDKSTTKRKKDGVFYTPKYITKYIVDNTVGKLCKEKKDELEIVEEAYFSDKKQLQKTKQILLNKLKTYREWLLQITICDPACGSGAFLNQALDFLITEHHYIDELEAKLLGGDIVFSNIETSILENNLFGVDLNEESVEIAKLSLWLRTAHPNRKLNNLNNNIKCGNSLIDDPSIAGEKAFNWHKEFPQVFGVNKSSEIRLIEQTPAEPNYLALIEEEAKQAIDKAEKAVQLTNEAYEHTQKVYKYAQQLQVVGEPEVVYGIKSGGFDVVIGNPPYVDSENMVKYNLQERLHLASKYKSAQGNWDLYVPFIEKATQICNSNGYVGFITPNKWLSMDYGKGIRDIVFSKLFKILDFTNTKVFDSANISSIVFILSNRNKTTIEINDTETKNIVIEKSLIKNRENLSLLLSNGFAIVEKMIDLKFKIVDFFEVHSSFTTSEAYELVDLVNESTENDTFKLINTGTIDRYVSYWGKSEITYLGKKLLKPSISKIDFQNKFPKRFRKMNQKKLIVTGI